jgi:hypothetical protein
MQAVDGSWLMDDGQIFLSTINSQLSTAFCAERKMQEGRSEMGQPTV